MDSQLCENADATINSPKGPAYDSASDDPGTEEETKKKIEQQKPVPRRMKKPKRNKPSTKKQLKQKCKPVDLDGNPIRRSYKKVSDAELRQKLVKMSEILARYKTLITGCLPSDFDNVSMHAGQEVEL